jgi:hypothetical protein
MISPSLRSLATSASTLLKAALEKLARYTGVYDKESEKAAGAVADAISDIQSRMSRAPIRRDVSQDGDK